MQKKSNEPDLKITGNADILKWLSEQLKMPPEQAVSVVLDKIRRK